MKRTYEHTTTTPLLLPLPLHQKDKIIKRIKPYDYRHSPYYQQHTQNTITTTTTTTTTTINVVSASSILSCLRAMEKVIHHWKITIKRMFHEKFKKQRLLNHLQTSSPSFLLAANDIPLCIPICLSVFLSVSSLSSYRLGLFIFPQTVALQNSIIRLIMTNDAFQWALTCNPPLCVPCVRIKIITITMTEMLC